MGKAGASAAGSVKRNTKPAPRSETAEKILDLAERLIQTRGCSAFSYQDIADALKIRKASIHYHFQSKTDLVIAVIDRYAERFDEMLDNIARDESATSMSMLEHYVEPYAAFAATPAQPAIPCLGSPEPVARQSPRPIAGQSRSARRWAAC